VKISTSFWFCFRWELSWRAALQAGVGFDPVILHQSSYLKIECLNTKVSFECFVCLINYSLIGCSLKIHRVKSALLAETAHS
jgi:hypothetical protein